MDLANQFLDFVAAVINQYNKVLSFCGDPRMYWPLFGAFVLVRLIIAVGIWTWKNREALADLAKRITWPIIEYLLLANALAILLMTLSFHNVESYLDFGIILVSIAAILEGEFLRLYPAVSASIAVALDRPGLADDRFWRYVLAYILLIFAVFLFIFARRALIGCVKMYSGIDA